MLCRLVNYEGSLLAYSGFLDRDASVTSAIASNIWKTYVKSATLAFENSNLETVLLECQVFPYWNYFFFLFAFWHILCHV